MFSVFQVIRRFLTEDDSGREPESTKFCFLFRRSLEQQMACSPHSLQQWNTIISAIFDCRLLRLVSGGTRKPVVRLMCVTMCRHVSLMSWIMNLWQTLLIHPMTTIVRQSQQCKHLKLPRHAFIALLLLMSNTTHKHKGPEREGQTIWARRHELTTGHRYWRCLVGSLVVGPSPVKRSRP